MPVASHALVAVDGDYLALRADGVALVVGPGALLRGRGRGAVVGCVGDGLRCTA